MNFNFSDEEEAAKELAEQILGDSTSFDRLREVESDDDGPGFDGELWASLAEANLIGLPISEDLGGQGFSNLALCLLLEQAGRNLAPVPLLESVVYTALPIERFGSDNLKKGLLPKVISGESILTAAFFEIGAPALSRKARTQAVASGDGYTLSGEKVCVPYAAAADQILVSASSEDGLGLFLIEPNAAGVSLAQQETTAHERQFVLSLDGVSVEGDAVLALPGKGEEIIDWLEPRAATALAAIAVGVANEGLRQTAVYTSERKQFGREIGSFQGVALRAADAYIDVEAMRSTMWQAAWRLDSGNTAHKAAAVAKWWACVGGHRVSHTCQHLHGGIGADIDYPIHRHFLRLKHIAMTLGGANEQLSRLGDLIADEARAGVDPGAILQ
ncbi:MAG: acyl-CoA dehydrogenase [Deltaproteobacteria bacterium]|nr:acyl-CoA dehydrogenase [Deltaproteobacteria bacterium]